MPRAIFDVEGLKMGLAEPKTQFRVYPNPASTQLTLEIEGNLSGTTEVLLINSLGQAIKIGNLTELRQNFDVANLPAGKYLLLLKGDNVTKPTKLIITR